MYSRGFETEDDDNEEHEDDEEAEQEDKSEDATPPLAVGRRGMMERDRQEEKKPILVDEKGIPYGALVSAFENDLRLLVRDLDPCKNFQGQHEALKDRFFTRVWAGK